MIQKLRRALLKYAIFLLYSKMGLSVELCMEMSARTMQMREVEVCVFICSDLMSSN